MPCEPIDAAPSADRTQSMPVIYLQTAVKDTENRLTSEPPAPKMTEVLPTQLTSNYPKSTPKFVIQEWGKYIHDYGRKVIQCSPSAYLAAGKASKGISWVFRIQANRPAYRLCHSLTLASQC